MRRLYDIPSCKPVISCITDASEARRIPLTLTVKKDKFSEVSRAVLFWPKKETVVKQASTRREM